MNGILVINKEKGITSAEELNEIKSILNLDSIGHTGTLDPIASGVLVCLLGKYTKLSDSITSLTKEYIATVRIGVKTNTLDLTGKVLEMKDESIDIEKLKKVINSYKKTYMQEVPLFSSVRINGRHLYEYARAGVPDIDLPKREVTIYDIELLNVSDNSFSFKCLVSKGTYIRSLIRDICNELNILGTMSDLVRTKQGIFDIKDSFTLEDIKNNNYKLYNIENVFDYESRIIDDSNRTKIMNGNVLEKNSTKDYIFFYENDSLKVIYKTHDTKKDYIKPLLFL